MGQLEDAVKAYRAAERTVERVDATAAARMKAAREERTRTRQALAEAIVESRRQGVRPIELERITGYSRERIRTILRSAGVEPD